MTVHAVANGKGNQEPVLPPVEALPGQETFEGMKAAEAISEQTETSVQEPVRELEAKPTTAAPDVKGERVRADPPEGTRFVGLGVPRQWWDDARAAFVTDFWDDEDDAPGTFRLWVARALAEYVEQSSVQRIDTAAAHVAPEGRKITRETALPIELVEQAEEARREDSRAMRSTVSRSVFISTALRVATEATRVRHGGTLDPAPARLPTRGFSA